MSTHRHISAQNYEHDSNSIRTVEEAIHINGPFSRLLAMSDTNAETHQHDPPADTMTTCTDNERTEEILANTASTTQESTPRRYPLDPYLQDRRDAKAAASDLRCTQQFLESYRLSVLGRREPDARIQLAIMPSFHTALRKFQAVAHPSERGRGR
jgi:hypothetical protein